MVDFRLSRRRLHLLAGGALLAVAACGPIAVEPARSAPSTAGTPHEMPETVGPTSAPSAAPSRAVAPPSVVDEPTPSPKPAVPLTQEERFLVLVLREDGATNCQPRRTGLPRRAVAGIECVIANEIVDRVGVYGFDYDDEAAALTYLERMQTYGALGAKGDCLAGSPQDTPHDDTPDGAWIEYGDQIEYLGGIYAQWRYGCFLNEHGIANFRATCDGNLVGVLGQNGDLAALSEWALQLPDFDEASGASYPGICAGALGGGLDGDHDDLGPGDTP